MTTRSLVDGDVAAGEMGRSVDATLRRVAVICRLLGWSWMVLLSTITLASDDNASAGVVVGALAIATIWTAVTFGAARSHRTFSSARFVVADGVVAAIVLLSSTIAGSEHFFHGGYPMSWLGIAAYAWGFRDTVLGSVALALEQGVVELAAGSGVVPIAGSVTFMVFGIVAGWSFSALREADRERLEARESLDLEQQERARFEERAELANRLHDSVLQTRCVALRCVALRCVALRREAGPRSGSCAERQVRYLARRQERELRGTIDEYRSPYDPSLRAALLHHCGEIEDLYKVEVDVVIRGDAEVDDRYDVAIGAARAALINAAKHSGRLDIYVYAELSQSRAKVYVRDRGVGYDVTAAPQRGVLHSLTEPVEAAGGSVEIKTAPGEGTEVVITMDRMR